MFIICGRLGTNICFANSTNAHIDARRTKNWVDVYELVIDYRKA